MPDKYVADTSANVLTRHISLVLQFCYDLHLNSVVTQMFTISSTIRSPAPYSPPRNRDYRGRDPLPPLRSRDYAGRDRSPRDSRASYSLSQSRLVSAVYHQDRWQLVQTLSFIFLSISLNCFLFVSVWWVLVVHIVYVLKRPWHIKVKFQS